MKKQRFFMLGIITVLVAVLSLTFVSSTFAKYTTDGQAMDTARVAKFGVVVEAGAVAAEVKETDGTTAEEHVTAGATELILAPGTKAITIADFDITGTPEVAVNVKYVATVDLANWQVNSEFYCPLTVTVGATVLNGKDYTSETAFEAAIKDEIDSNKDYSKGSDLSTADEPVVTVAWAFDGDDAKDTELGDNAADGNAATISITIDCTVTQID